MTFGERCQQESGMKSLASAKSEDIDAEAIGYENSIARENMRGLILYEMMKPIGMLRAMR